MQLRSVKGDVKTLWSANLPPTGAALSWLGQAGFALRTSTQRLLIDPYLSDHLAIKYAGKKFPHTRMMTAPAQPHDLPGIDLVLCTHRHSDHMDPLTLPAIAKISPTCRFITPRAELDHASTFVPPDRLVPISAGETTLGITALPSAHEDLKTDARGDHHFLGYIIHFAGTAIYHSGDCVPYPGLAEELRKHAIDLALLPVNGRDEQRRSSGVPGNMTFTEAVQLCRDATIPTLIPHHFGMFDFNTVPRDQLASAISATRDINCILPDTEHWYQLTGDRP